MHFQSLGYKLTRECGTDTLSTNICYFVGRIKAGPGLNN